MKKITSILIIILSQLCCNAWGQSFVVKQIRIQGLQRVTPDTVENYMPIKRGQTLRPGQTTKIIQSLYKTGFFEQISLSQDGNTLIVNVKERPTIGQLKISGNSIIPTDKLTSVMRSLDIAEGRVYNPAILERIKNSLLSQYYQLGRYNARVEVTTARMTRNRIMVTIDISEGLVAKIRRISIIGNHAFSQKTLINQLPITTSGLLTIFTQTDRYSEARLEESTEKLRNFYSDHGYLHLEVKSAQAEVTPDRKSVYVTIVIDEGQPYSVHSLNVQGALIYPKEEYLKRISIKPGQIFSRQKVIDSQKSISRFLGEKGYMFANISLTPEINEKTHEITLSFQVKPGKRTYIRHITFSDNARTNDVVLRREMEQMEAAPASTTKLDASKQRLSLLPYLKEVEMSLKPVPEMDDQVDVNYRVKEDNSAQASFKLGYSQAYKLVLGAGINQKNFLGTGNTLGINVNRSNYEQFFGIEYTDPYYTPEGISRSLNLSVSRVDPDAIAKLNSSYTMNQFYLGMTYGIPVGQEIGAFNRVYFGLNLQSISLNVSRAAASNQILDFIDRHGTHYQELDIKLGYTRNSYDRAIFPTRGSLQSIFVDTYAPLSSNSLSFYTMNYHGKLYLPLSNEFIFMTRADFGYGNGFHGIDGFPFFKNFYAGGIDTVRGYQPYTLGPIDSKGMAFGGNMLADASLALIFPNFISENLRTSVFFDAGNVYTSLNNRAYGGQSTTSGPIRYSTGIEADWLTPFGPVQLSFAIPFKRRGDQQDRFQYALGANF